MAAMYLGCSIKTIPARNGQGKHASGKARRWSPQERVPHAIASLFDEEVKALGGSFGIPEIRV
jgi:hypothetical protein